LAQVLALGLGSAQQAQEQRREQVRAQGPELALPQALRAQERLPGFRPACSSA